MAHLEQVRDPDLSLWQSAVDEVVAKKTGGVRVQSVGEAPVIQRPDTSNQMVAGAAIDAKAEAENKPLQLPAGSGREATEDIATFTKFCSNAARQLAIAKIKGDKDAVTAAEEQFKKFGQCDPGWLEVAQKYAEFQLDIKLHGGQVPYRKWNSIDDFVLDGKLPDNAMIGIVGDWATGQDAAKQVLRQISDKKPDVVIHLGDIYYSCTDFEAQNYFLQVWKQFFDPDKVPSFTLSGNHDMFGGGAPYYKLLDQLHQPASYCCLRNQNWQFVMIDTGLHDRTPGGLVPTFLEDSEVEWLQRRIDTADGRKTVLLSHHQLFTRYSNINDPPGLQTPIAINSSLQRQVENILPHLTVWLWGHEHDLVIYERQMNVLARCVGHGGFPVATFPPRKLWHAEIPAEDVNLSENGNFFTNGYAMMKLNGANATIQYYEDTDEDNPLKTEEL